MHRNAALSVDPEVCCCLLMVDARSTGAMLRCAMTETAMVSAPVSIRSFCSTILHGLTVPLTLVSTGAALAAEQGRAAAFCATLSAYHADRVLRQLLCAWREELIPSRSVVSV